MNEAHIKKGIVRYLALNADRLGGTLSENPQEDFLVTGKLIKQGTREEPIAARGYIIDVIADLIERSEFFGYGVPKNSRSVASNQNAGIWSLENLDMYEISLFLNEAYLTDDELGRISEKPRIVEPKGYLEELRKFARFRKEAHTLDDISNPDSVTRLLFNLDRKPKRLARR